MGRVLRFPLTRVVLYVAAILVANRAAIGFAHWVNAPKPLRLAMVVVAVVGAYVGSVRAIERRRVTELVWVGDLPLGVVGGTLLFTAVFGLLVVVGSAQLAPGDGWRVALDTLCLMIVVGLVEEAIMRGVVFRVVEESLGTTIALAFSAALFGVLHAFNDGATLMSTIAIALEAGVLLAAAYLVNRSLWLPIGFHIGWNYAEGGIFGAAVSGHPGAGFWHSTFTGADLVSGGAFGPEASIVAVLVCLPVGAAMLVLARKRGQWRPPYWRRSAPSEAREV